MTLPTSCCRSAPVSSASIEAKTLGEGTSQTRLFSIDLVRAVAAFAVICIHTVPSDVQSTVHWLACTPSQIVTQLARFAVPFFFLTSGFFLAKGMLRTPPLSLLARYARRLGVLYLAWVCIYAVAPDPHGVLHLGLMPAMSNATWSRIATMREDPWGILQHGYEIHLWFFPSLLVGAFALAVATALRQDRILLGVGVICYVLAVLRSSYVETPIGLRLWEQVGNGPLLAIAYVPAGFLIAHCRRVSTRTAWFTILLGIGLHFGEVFSLQYFSGRPISQNDFVFSTPLLGIGALLLATSRDQFRFPGSDCLATIGTCGLGIYVSHILIRPWMFMLWKFVPDPRFWAIAAPFLLFALAAVFTLLLRRVPVARRLVS